MSAGRTAPVRPALALPSAFGEARPDPAMTQGPPLAGPDVAGYRAEALLGRGGMGEVYRALDVRLGRPVALKLLAAGVPEEGRLLRESRLAAAIDHPNVIPIYEAGEDHGRVFIAMRYVAGGDLKALLRREGALEPARAIAIAAQVADALDAAHRRGLVHRDVKPSNVLLDRQEGREHAYLADFGLSQSVAERGPADGQFMGTVDYVAPEQIRGDAIDGRADQYGLACLLFECLCGAIPYRAPLGRRGDLRAPRGAGAARLRAEPSAASGGRRGVRARDGEGPGRPLRRRAPRSWRRRARRSGSTPRAAASRRRLASPARRSRRSSPPASPPRWCSRRVTRPAVPAPVGDAVADRPGHERRDRARAGRRASRQPRGHRRRRSGWRASATGVLWRYQPGARPARARDVERRAARPRRARRQGLRGRRREVPLGRRLALRRGDRGARGRASTCSPARSRPARACCGRPGARSCSGSAPTTGGCASCVEVFLPFQAPCDASRTRRVQFRELAVGGGSLWVLGDALDRRMWRLDARTGRIRGHDRAAASRRRRSPSRAGRSGSPTASATARSPSTSRRPRAARGRVGRGASGVAAGAGALWVANTLDGTVSRIDPARAAGRGDGRGRRPPARGRRRRRRGLGDRACAVSSAARGWWRRPPRCGRAARAAAASAPLRIGVVVDCVGIYRSLEDAELSGAALPLIERGARAAGPARWPTVSGRARRRPRRRARARLHRGVRVLDARRRAAPARRARARRTSSSPRATGPTRSCCATSPAATRTCRSSPSPTARARSTLSAPAAEPLPLRRRSRAGRRRPRRATPTASSAGGARRSCSATGTRAGAAATRSRPSSARSAGGVAEPPRWSQFDPAGRDVARVPRDVDGVAVFASAFHGPAGFLRGSRGGSAIPRGRSWSGRGWSTTRRSCARRGASLPASSARSSVDRARMRAYLRAFARAFPGVPCASPAPSR